MANGGDQNSEAKDVIVIKDKLKPDKDTVPTSAKEQVDKAEDAAQRAFDEANLKRMKGFYDQAEQLKDSGNYEKALKLYEMMLDNIVLIKNNPELIENITIGALKCVREAMEREINLPAAMPNNEVLRHFNKALRLGIKYQQIIHNAPEYVKNGFLREGITGSMGINTILMNQIDGRPDLSGKKNDFSEFCILIAELHSNIYPPRKSSIWQFKKVTQEPGFSGAIEAADKKRVKIHEDERKIKKIDDPFTLLDRITNLVSQKKETYEEEDERKDREEKERKKEEEEEKEKKKKDSGEEKLDKKTIEMEKERKIEEKRLDKKRKEMERERKIESYNIRGEISKIITILSSVFKKIKNNDPTIVKERWEPGFMLEKSVAQSELKKSEDSLYTANIYIKGFDNLMHEWLSGKKYIREEALMQKVDNLLKRLCDLMDELHKYDDSETGKKKTFGENEEFVAIENMLKKMRKENASSKDIAKLSRRLQVNDEWDKAGKGDDSIDPRVEHAMYLHSIGLYLGAIKFSPEKDKFEALFGFLDKVQFGNGVTEKYRKEIEKADSIPDTKSKKERFAELYESLKKEIESNIKNYDTKNA
jgi:hypothetical protein